MPQAVDSTMSVLDQFSEKLNDLERRVAALERQPETPAPPQFVSAALQRPQPPAIWGGFPSARMPAGAVPVLGKAVVGMAGAYLLRAIAESGSVPKFPVLLIALAYAAFWLVWAVRAHLSNPFASVTFAVTSALILSPLLWESTVRFQVLSPAFTAVVLAAFAGLAVVLSCKHDLQWIPWIAMLAAVSTTFALILATRELVPLTAALLAGALATELAACFGHRLSMRALPALAADFAVWLLIYILASPGSLPESYHPVAGSTIAFLCLALLVIYGLSIGIRCFGHRHRITFFEVAQGVVAFLLATFGAIRATGNSIAAPLAVLFLVLSAASYWGTLVRFADESQTRNRRVTATWAAGLLLAGTFLLFPANFQVPLWSVCTLAAAWLYTRTAKISLGLHAVFYLAASLAVSSLPGYVSAALTATIPASPSWTLWTVAATSTLCYLIGSRTAESNIRQLLWVLAGATAGFTAAALTIALIVWFAGGRIELGASRLSVIRTVVLCCIALSFGFLGSRSHRLELSWIAYAAVGFGTLKLLFEDLRFGNAASLVVSLLFYGLVLILLPRFPRAKLP